MSYQDERENLSGLDQEEYFQWIESIEGSYLCPYCQTISAEKKMCCGENHMQLISEGITKDK